MGQCRLKLIESGQSCRFGQSPSGVDHDPGGVTKKYGQWGPGEFQQSTSGIVRGVKRPVKAGKTKRQPAENALSDEVRLGKKEKVGQPLPQMPAGK